MAEIRPLRGWRYRKGIGKMEDLTSPLFDLSEKSLLDQLYKHPYNINHLFLPSDVEAAAITLKNWKENNVLVQDALPAIYVYSQSFQSRLTGKRKNITGFISNVKLHEWIDQVILRHENIMPHSVSHRSEILEKTLMHFCPLHALYTDEGKVLESWMDESLQVPFAELTDVQGISHRISVIQDLKVIREFGRSMQNKPVILADGHHRYEASLNLYRQTGYKKPYLAYLPMFLTNTESNDLEIYPTHRLIKNLEDWNKEDFIRKLNAFFWVESIEDPNRLEHLLKDKKHSFGLVFKDLTLLVTLKPDSMNEMSWKFPEQIKELDLTVLHYFIIEKGLGIEGKYQKNSKNISFSFNFTKSVSKVLQGEFQLVIITRAVTQEEIKKVCYSGFTLPHKSTYFFPKVLCGLIAGSISENDFSGEMDFR